MKLRERGESNFHTLTLSYVFKQRHKNSVVVFYLFFFFIGRDKGYNRHLTKSLLESWKTA